MKLLNYSDSGLKRMINRFTDLNLLKVKLIINLIVSIYDEISFFSQK